MNAYKKNQFLKYQIISEDDDPEDIALPEEHTTKPIVEPIPALIEYVKEKYDMDVSEEVKDYESKINRDKTD
jgi:hypothetical protein